MAPKQSRPKANSKPEVAEKVREIKQRQEKWLKEREKQKSRGSPTEGFKSPAPPRSVVRQTHTIRKVGDPSAPGPGNPSPGSSTSSISSSNQSGITSGSKGSKLAGFHSWIKNKEQQRDAPSRTNDELGQYSGSTPDHGTNTSSSEQLLSRARQRSLSPEMFETLADQIIDKVKRELHFNGSQGTSLQPDEGTARSNGVSRREDGESKIEGLQSHHCQICSQVMMAPSRTPLLLIPCGHTFCSACSEAQNSCPSCQTPVQSATPNLMLQQVITEYQQQKQSRVGAASRSSNKPSSRNRPPRDYHAEYDNLQVRCEVLEAEAEDIHGRMMGIEQSIKDKDRQAEDVRQEELIIDEQIEQLREEQRQLEAHRQSFNDEREQLQERRLEEEARLNMVTTTLKDLRRDMAKIKRLVNGTPH